MALTKVAETQLYAAAVPTASVLAVTNTIDVSTYYQLTLRMRFGRINGTVFTNAPIFRIEGSLKSGTPNESQWNLINAFQPALGVATIFSQAINTTAVSVNDTTLKVAAPTSFLTDDPLCIYDAVTPANSEWRRSVSHTNATPDIITISEKVLIAHVVTSTIVSGQAEEYLPQFDVTGFQSVRIAIDNIKNAVGFLFEASYSAVSGL